MIGPNENKDLVEWRTRTIDGETVYELEYSEPVTEPTEYSKTLFGASSGGTVPAHERTIELPDGTEIPITEAVYDADGTTLRIRHQQPSVVDRLRRYLPF